MLEMKIAVAMILLQFEVSVVDEARPLMELVLRNDGPLRLRLTERARQ